VGGERGKGEDEMGINMIKVHYMYMCVLCAGACVCECVCVSVCVCVCAHVCVYENSIMKPQ
jgi:hypothetical protein